MQKNILKYVVLACALLGIFIVTKRWQAHQDATFKEEFGIVETQLKPTLSGSYLAARFATGNDDLSSAARFYGTALDKLSDQSDVQVTDKKLSKDKKDLRDKKIQEDKEFLKERALPTAIGGGKIQEALALAGKMDLKQPTMNSQIAVMVLLVDAFKSNNTDEINKLLPLLRDAGFGKLLSPLLEVWASVLKQDVKTAIAKLDQLEKDYPSIQPLVNAQKAFVYETQQDKGNAEKYYIKSFDENLSLRSAWLIGQFYERQQNRTKAEAIYTRINDKMPEAVLPKVALQRLDNGDWRGESVVRTVQDGVASAMYDVASVLYQEGSPRLAILYAQMSYYLAPKDPFVNLLLGDIFSTSQTRGQALGFYESIDQDNDLYLMTQFRLAQLYESMGHVNSAFSLLDKLMDNKLVRRDSLSEIADIYRRQEEYTKAVPYYNKIIDEIKKPVESDWAVYYSRAICLERTGSWKQAEVDLKTSLSLSPDQPEVLNYLAYTWVDHGKNMPKALSMLQRALAAAPQDPYITDSVGWALFRLNQFEESVKYFEAAITGLPDDPTVNDHLGDAYWRVGRQREAEFQWKRALTHASPKDVKQISSLKKKLRYGLPPLPKLASPLNTKKEKKNVIVVK
jgi:tetratricopeptide (TPR) repeat protein